MTNRTKLMDLMEQQVTACFTPVGDGQVPLRELGLKYLNELIKRDSETKDSVKSLLDEEDGE